MAGFLLDELRSGKDLSAGDDRFPEGVPDHRNSRGIPPGGLPPLHSTRALRSCGILYPRHQAPELSSAVTARGQVEWKAASSIFNKQPNLPCWAQARLDVRLIAMTVTRRGSLWRAARNAVRQRHWRRSGVAQRSRTSPGTVVLRLPGLPVARRPPRPVPAASTGGAADAPETSAGRKRLPITSSAPCAADTAESDAREETTVNSDRPSARRG